jgi:hypothetical protein
VELVEDILPVVRDELLPDRFEHAVGKEMNMEVRNRLRWPL